MEIINKNIDELKEYKNNPRNNEKAIDVVAESIKNFGFKNPIIIDVNNVIVAGHTRLLAAKKLKLKTVPCIMADDLTEEQIKAFRLVDNKTSEFASWDYEKLDEELFSIENIDMSTFDFELKKFEEELKTFDIQDEEENNVFIREEYITPKVSENTSNTNDTKEETDNFIKDLYDEDFINLNPNREIYNVTFTFPVEMKEELNRYFRINGKEHIVSLIIEEVAKCQTVEAK